MSGWDALLVAIRKSSWRTFVGVFAATGLVLVFSHVLGVTQWVEPIRGYLILVCIASGTVSLSYAITTAQKWMQSRRSFVDLRMVVGSPLHTNWSIGMAPITKEPMLMLICEMNFAHCERGSVILKRAHLKGTTEAFPINEIVVNDSCEAPKSICLGVTPIKSQAGQPLTGRLVFVDQFNQKHKSDKITFRPNTVPKEMHERRLQSSPNCVFCNERVELKDQALEAQMSAHIKCVWK